MPKKMKVTCGNCGSEANYSTTVSENSTIITKITCPNCHNERKRYKETEYEEKTEERENGRTQTEIT